MRAPLLCGSTKTGVLHWSTSAVDPDGRLTARTIVQQCAPPSHKPSTTVGAAAPANRAKHSGVAEASLGGDKPHGMTSGLVPGQSLGGATGSLRMTRPFSVTVSVGRARLGGKELALLS